MKKIVLSVALLGALYANDDYARQRSGINDNTAIETRQVTKNNKDLDINDEQDNTFAVIYNHIQEYERKHEKDGTMYQATNFDNSELENKGFDFYADKQKQLAEQKALAQAEQSKLTEKISWFINGYCVLKNKVQIGRLAGYADLNCDMSLDKEVTLKVALTPDFYSYSLIATPLYIMVDDKRFVVNGGAVQNGLRTSINVASRVDDFLISRIIADTGVKSASVMTDYAQEWIDERKSYRESRNNQTNKIYSQNNSSTIVTENSANNNEKPKVGDYLGSAIVSIVGTLIESAGNAYLQTRDFAFEIDKDTILYTDLEIDATRQALRGVGFVPDNLNIQQPSTNFDDSDPTNGLNFNRLNINSEIGFNDNPTTRQTEQSTARQREPRNIRQEPRKLGNQRRQNTTIYNGGYNGGVIR